ncbi:MAG TPA: NADH:ubiquinone reductase (Na(+)-transporting) subunit D [Kiritimatiellia bacterium]|nr:NADH:ubiquinone reductase (Na(+)-transporting) subunit D [Kiritimatiellia bacterium]HRZ11055.1 NADH:ubiquinone reductase (Na(+)-transporting) subunit D [Kiritimatiellia bacterium]HSA18628.1 NADH:ubiquinone reductase (Na(+)-transporting) subunit D [Kiritimatiellia bacterium]
MSGMAGNLKKVLVDPLSENNPVTIQILGICSSLAVTVKLETALVMAIGLTVVTAGSNWVISLLRNTIPSKIRMIVEMAVVSVLVIVADQFLRAYLFEISRQLSVFVGLIITNCIVMGRLEAYALQNPPGLSFLDGIGNGLGYSLVLVIVASVREILGSGKWLGFRVIPEAAYSAGYINNGFMLLAPGAFIVLGLLIWVQRTLSKKFETD